MRPRNHLILLVTALTFLAPPTLGETRSCKAPNVSVSAQDPTHAAMVCTAANRAAALFTSCNVPALSNPVKIQVVSDMTPDCFGLYDCAENTIDVLSPRIMQERRNSDSVFAHLSTPAYFQSIVVHELAHAATHDMPCPFKLCNVGAEYVAYAMQVMSLSEASRIHFEQATDMKTDVPDEDLNRFLLFLVPEFFAQKVWAHLSRRNAPCDYIADLIAGTVILDQPVYALE